METKNLPNTIESLLSREDVKKRFLDMLGKKAAGFLSSILTLTNQSKALREADPKTILSAAAIAASLDLPINPNLGFAHIIPYKSKGEEMGRAQFQMGWKGFVQLGQRSAQYRTINVAVVCEGELIDYNKFTGEMKFDQNAKKSDKAIGYVAYIRLINGFEKYFYMSYEEARAHGKRYSRSFNNPDSPWQTMFDAMAKKTVIKLLLARWGTLSVDMQMAVQADQAVIKETPGEQVEFDYVDGKEEIMPPDETEPAPPDPDVISAFDSMVIEKNVDREIFDPWLAKQATDNKMALDEIKIAIAKSDEASQADMWEHYAIHLKTLAVEKEKETKAEKKPGLFGKKK